MELNKQENSHENEQENKAVIKILIIIVLCIVLFCSITYYCTFILLNSMERAVDKIGTFIEEIEENGFEQNIDTIFVINAGLDYYENLKAIEILEQCGIKEVNWIKNEGNNRYYINSVKHEINDILITFYSDNSIRKIEYLGTTLYKNDKVYYTIDDFMLSKSEKKEYKQIILKEAKDEFGEVKIEISNDNNKPVFVKNVGTKNVVVTGVLIITDNDNTIITKSFSARFLKKDLLKIKFDDFNMTEEIEVEL